MTENEIVKAYLRGAEWAWQNGDDRDYVAKAAWDYADKQGSTLVSPPEKCPEREALRFYADPANWIDTPDWDGDGSGGSPKAIPVDRSQEGSPCDCGDKARDALAGVGAATSPEREEAKRLVALWMLLDDIDTASDMAKSDNVAYREAVERIQRKRFDIISGVEFDALRRIAGGA